MFNRKKQEKERRRREQAVLVRLRKYERDAELRTQRLRADDDELINRVIQSNAANTAAAFKDEPSF